MLEDVFNKYNHTYFEMCIQYWLYFEIKSNLMLD